MTFDPEIYRYRREPSGFPWWMLLIVAGWFVALALIVMAGSAFGSNPPQVEPARESVDLIEVNHFYDEQGRLVFDQTIFYRWCSRGCRYHVIAWRLIKHPSQIPARDWPGGGWLSVWQDGELIRHVRAESVRETWTQYDPELEEREWLPKERRVELLAVKADKPSGAIGQAR